MQTINKYKISVFGKSELLLPTGARILSIEQQDNLITLYTLVAADEQMTEHHEFIVYRTGLPIDIHLHDHEFLGTVTMTDDRIRLHVFHKKTKARDKYGK